MFVSSFIGWIINVDPSLARQYAHHADGRVIHFEWDRDGIEAFQREYKVLWMAPFWTKSGYGTEAISFVTGLEEALHSRVMVWQYGDKAQSESVNPKTSKMLDKMRDRIKTWDTPVVGICHATPYTWWPGSRLHRQCPPPNAAIRIGRTMFESNSVPLSWIRKIEPMDQIWVPTKFHIDTFTAAGVPREKLFSIPEAVDSIEFDPEKASEKFVFPESFNTAEFIFISIFKWEERKGWKYLVKAFSEEFGNESNIKLYIVTHTQKEDPEKDLKAYFGDENLLHNIHISMHHLSHPELISLYKSSGAFVLSSHGEGWGRPVVEAMSMEMPVIVTDWSGPSEYLTEENSFPLPISPDLIPVDASMGGEDVRGHLWAEPSVYYLKRLMRQVVKNPEEAKKRGKQARKDMVEKYSTEVVSKLVAQQIELAVALFANKTLEQIDGNSSRN